MVHPVFFFFFRIPTGEWNLGFSLSPAPAIARFLMLSAVDLCHLLLRSHLSAGDWALDATAGNGHDTLFLARQVGPGGRVFAFDIQRQAVEATRALLESNHISGEAFQLHQACHSSFTQHLPPDAAGRLKAILFNLGYLPGGDKSIITTTATTESAVTTALSLLHPGGLLLIVAYPGHEGGNTEAALLRNLAQSLPMADFHAAEYHTLNAGSPAPFVLILQKSSSWRALQTPDKTRSSISRVTGQ